ncbi:MAG: hypothetical protein AAFZ63_25655 [Bacteroidota bacterium]
MDRDKAFSELKAIADKLLAAGDPEGAQIIVKAALKIGRDQ